MTSSRSAMARTRATRSARRPARSPDAPGGRPERAARRVRTLFFGSGSFAVAALDSLVDHPPVELVGVVSVPDRPSGRQGVPTSVPVAARARALGVPLLQPASIRAPEAVEAIRALAPELGVLADYGRIVPPGILAIHPLGILNLHPSLLPRHRGAAPIAGTILAGDDVAGVTIIRMDEGLDTGPIVAAVSWPLSGTENAADLESRAAAEAATLLRLSLPGWLDGSLGAHPQPEVGATLTRPLRRADGRLDPVRPAARLERQVRAFQPWPGSFLETVAGRVVVWRASVIPAELRGGASEPRAARPGSIVVEAGQPALSTSAGLLVLEEVQPAGGRRMTGAELLRGRPALTGSRVMESQADDALAPTREAPDATGEAPDPAGTVR
ncbi:MAG TPA: methionyl-tRNA formyltransferase [Candidatus Limnocylindrales bacterium]